MGSESKWVTDVFRLGLCYAGVTRCARDLRYPTDFLYVTNEVLFGFYTVWRFLPLAGAWTIEPLFGPAIGHFPYGVPVTPP